MITLVHPSRGRAEVAHKCYSDWRSKSKSEFEYILVIDSDDKDLNKYLALFDGLKIVVGESKNVVEAMNLGATKATGDIIVGISDDFSCPENWDEYLYSKLDINKEEALLVNDGHDEHLMMTIPILTKKLYDRLGYIYYPKFTGIYADNHIAEYCDKLGVLKRNREKVFLHKHWAYGHYTADETNKRHDNPEGWMIGRRVIEEFRKNNYGV